MKKTIEWVLFSSWITLFLFVKKKSTNNEALKKKNFLKALKVTRPATLACLLFNATILLIYPESPGCVKRYSGALLQADNTFA